MQNEERRQPARLSLCGPSHKDFDSKINNNFDLHEIALTCFFKLSRKAMERQKNREDNYNKNLFVCVFGGNFVWERFCSILKKDGLLSINNVYN